MKPIIFLLSDQKELAEAITKECGYERGDLTIHLFPDEEICVRINSSVKNRRVILLLSLDKPNDKLSSLLFVAATLRELGAQEIGLIAPYLAYMRQDKQFNPGEGISAKYFASFLSNTVDSLVTIDPHLHRFHALNEIYTIPATVLHASEAIANWIKQHVENPLLIGPDQESQQWVTDIAQRIGAPLTVLEKQRTGDHSVSVSIPHIAQYKNHTPILIDDIISTARTMIETVKQVNTILKQPPICIGVHALFVGDAYEALLKAGVDKVVTCNTIRHPSNAIDINGIIAQWLISSAP